MKCARPRHVSHDLVRLGTEDSRTLAELLGVSQVAKELSELEQDVEGLAVDRLPLAAASPFDGGTIGDTQARTRTGSIVPASRGDAADRLRGRVNPTWGRHTRRRGDASRNRRMAVLLKFGLSDARLGVPARARRRHPAARGLGAGRQRFGFSPIPLYLLAGLAFGQGGIVPLVTADRFIAAGAEIGLILLLFSLDSSTRLASSWMQFERPPGVGAMRGSSCRHRPSRPHPRAGGALIARGEFSIGARSP